MALQVTGTITVFIERCRNLHASADPYVCVKLGKRKLMSTHTIGNTAFPVWEHEDKFFLEGKINKDTALSVNVYDSDGVTSKLLGEHEVTIAALMAGPIECGKENDKGFKLTKKTKDGSVETLESMIWFKMTYAVLRDASEVPKDVPQYNIENFKNDPKQGICKFHIIGASHLPKTEMVGRCDPYVTVSVEQESLKFKKVVAQTKVIGNTLHARWEEVLEIYLSGIFLDDTSLVFSVLDEDTGMSDDFVGSYKIPIYEFFNKKKVGGKHALAIGDKWAKKMDASKPPTIEFEAEFEEVDEAPPKFKLRDIGDLQALKWKKEGHKVY